MDDDLLLRLDAVQRETRCTLMEAKMALDAHGGDVGAAIAAIKATRAASSGVSTEGRILGVVAHAAAFVGFPVLIPLIILLLTERQPFARGHAKQALGWHLAVLAASLVTFPTAFGPVVIVLFGLVMAVIAVIKAAQGEVYRYPVIGDWVAEL